MSQAMKRVFGEGFRVFFLSAGLFAVIAMLLWLVWLVQDFSGAVWLRLPVAPPPYLWHAHEMIFGYAGAAMGGFLLTAVPNWTGTKSARHLFIAVASGVWLAGRIAMFYSGELPAGLVAVLDLAFLPILGAKIASQLVRRPKPQNMMFLGLISLIWAGNLMLHLEWTGLTQDSAARGLRLGLLATSAMIAVLGGRVTPAFTRNAMLRTGRESALPVSRKPVEIVAIVAAIALALSVATGLPALLNAGLALLAGAAQFARLAGWRSGWTIGQPILWSLHLAIAMLGLGYLMLGLSALGIGAEPAALHILGIGAIGGMTLAVMSRAILGHGGRALIAPAPVALGYRLVAAAALLRWAAAYLSGPWYPAAILGAGTMWIVAFGLFTVTLWPILYGPRPARAPVGDP